MGFKMTMNASRIEYFNLEGFEGIYLEDSFVLDIAIHFNTIILKMEFVLRDVHQFYCKPQNGEEYCYKTGNLIISPFTKMKCELLPISRSIDAAGEVDFGNIDQLFIIDDIIYISGDWGSLEINAKNIQIEFL